MKGVFANRTRHRDFVVNELELRGVKDCEVFIAVAFFTEADVVRRLLDKGCVIRIVVRLGFPTSPKALKAVIGHPNLSLRFYSSMSFHPKLYIFGDDVALVGSANLTHSAITSNQEVVVGISGNDERFPELASVFQNYWDDSDVLTPEKLAIYEQSYKKFESHENATEKLAREVADALGNTAPANIARGERKRSKQTLFLANYRKTYQEAVSAFAVVRRAYETVGYRKANDQDIPLRLEIDSFISFVRETECVGGSWQTGPYRTEPDQITLVQKLVEKWRTRKWPHFQERIVGVTYPNLMRVFASRDSIEKASDDDLFEALCALHSFHDRLRFFDGGMATWKRVFLAANSSKHVRSSLCYLVFGEGDVVERMANMIFNEDYKLAEFGQANVQELIGWRNKEELPVINGRTTKVLRFLGGKVRQVA